MNKILCAAAVLVLILQTALSFALEVGDKAPDFTAVSTHGDITLSRVVEQGPVVLAFYYANFTPG